MISRFSVKKPYTVMVGIVLVLILGVVSLGKMNTDLLPSMNLPYAIVMTTYQGANPETVETVVTRPIEQSMATVSDIENVSSQSSENMSLVILQFQESTNMDSVTLEIREKLDQISGYWDDYVGKPMIMKLNPDMLPIMIAAVEVDGMDAAEVTDYVDRHLLAEIESVAGVASVSATGSITESVDIFVREEKIRLANEKVMEALDKTFDDARQELMDAQKELDEGREEMESGREELESGREELESGREKMESGFAQGKQQIASVEAEMASGESQINSQLQLLDEKQQELNEGRQQIIDGRAKAEEGLTQLTEAQTGIETLNQALTAMTEQEVQLSAAASATAEGIAAIEQQLVILEQNPEALDYEIVKAQLLEQRAQAEQQYGAVMQGLAEIQVQKDALTEQLNQILAAFGQSSAEEAITYIIDQSTNIWNTMEELAAAEAQLNEGQVQLDAAREQLNAAKSQIVSGKTQITSGKTDLSIQETLASLKLSMAEAQIASGEIQLETGEAQLEEAQKQIDSGWEQLEEGLEQVKDQTSLSNLITKDLIKGILAGENFSMPAGYIQEEEDQYLVRVGDKVQNLEELKELVILDLGLEDLEPIRLGDVADVTMTDDGDQVYARLNGNPGIMLTMEKQTGYSTGDVTDRLLERIEEIENERENVHFSVLMDQGVYIDLVVDSVVQNMLSGAALAILILFFFMKSIKPTIVIACSIPISVVAAFVLMYFSNITLNVISLSGLALGIGMLVDNSIVVIENIDRLRQLGIPARKAAVKGAQEVAGAIAASTLTTVCVFAPIVFTEGITRQLFVDMGLTIAYSLLASLVVALTLVPMMSSVLLSKSKPKKFPVFDAIKNIYGKILSGALRVKFLVLLLAVGMLVGSVYAALKNGTAFMPPMESTQISMTISVDKEASFQELMEVSDQVIASIEDIEDIESIGAMAGGSGMAGMMGGGGSEGNSVSVYLILKEDKVLSGSELEQEILRRTEEFPCEVAVTTQSMDMSAMGGSGIQIQIKGKELDELARIATELAGIVEQVEGTQNVSNGQEEAELEYRIMIDKAKAMSHKLTVAQVYQEIQKRLAEGSSATTLSTAEKDYSVYVRDEKDEKLSRELLQDMILETTDNEGNTVELRLSEIADFTEATGPQTIMRDSQSRYMTVSAEIAMGHNIGIVSAELEKRLAEYEIPNGYTIAMKGEDETINEAMGQLMLMLILALVFMYLIMVAQFQSLLSPFIIMFTVPLAFTGGFMALLIADMEVSVIAVIGFVMLSGIIVNNGIVLVDYTNQLRAEGMQKREALVQAGKDRLRPIIMTALTTVLGLSTMAAGVGMGGDMVQPMAVVTIGGLIYGTLLTLIVVPCIYDVFNRKEYKKNDLELEEAIDGYTEE